MPFISEEELQERLKSPLNLRINGTPTFPQDNIDLGVPLALLEPDSGADDIDPDSYPEPNVENEEITNGKLNVKQVPLQLRKTFSLLNKVEGEKAGDIAKTFDVSKDSVNRSLNGNITNSDDAMKLSAFHDKIEEHIDDRRAKSESLAVDTLLEALNIIPKELSKQKFSTQVSTAKTMADIANMMGRKGSAAEPTVHFHIMTPPMKKLRDYEIIEVDNVAE